MFHSTFICSSSFVMGMVCALCYVLVVTFKKLDGPLNSGVSRKRKKSGTG